MGDRANDAPITPLGIIFVAAATVCVIGYELSVASDTSAPKRALDAAGYTDARVDSGSIAGEWDGCAKHEIAYDAEATNVRGARVHLLVCCGPYLKGCTVRSK